jgi:hypothetical protein
VPNQDDGLCGESLLNRRWLTHENAPSRGVFFEYMRITGALATSLALHLAAGMLNFRESPGGPSGQTLPPMSIGSRQEILATLTPPTGFDNRLSTSLPFEAGSSDPIQESESPPLASGQQASTSTGTQTSSSSPTIRYFERHEVDRPPRIIVNLDARDGPLEKALAEFDVDGSIIIECMISDRGRVDELNVVTTTLPDTVAQVIIQQAKLARFIPAKLNHVAVPSRIMIELSIREKPKVPSTEPTPISSD